MNTFFLRLRGTFWNGYIGMGMAILLTTASIYAGAVRLVLPGTSPDNAFLSSLAPGDTVYFKEGVHRVSITPKVSGTQQKPITFAAYPGENVILDGRAALTGWVKLSGNIYCAEFDWGRDPYGKLAPTMVYDHDSVMIRAQYPNQKNPYDPWDISVYLVQENGGVNWLQDNELPIHFSYTGAKLNVNR